MATSVERMHTTPYGGVRSVTNYQDGTGAPVEEELATQSEIIEYDGDGNIIARSVVQHAYGDPQRKAPAIGEEAPPETVTEELPIEDPEADPEKRGRRHGRHGQ